MKTDFHNLIKTTFNSKGQFVAYINTKTEKEAEKLGEYSEIECEVFETEDTNYKYSVQWTGSNAIDLISWLDDNDSHSYVLQPLSPAINLQCLYNVN